MKINLFFNAPIDFDPAVMDEYGKAFTMGGVPRAIQAIVCNPKAPFVIDSKYLDHFPDLRILATPSTGTNHIDLEACRQRNVKVISLLDDREGLETISASSEFAFRMILDAMRMPPAHELQGKIVGLIGFGRIGRRLANWLEVMGCRVRLYDPDQRYRPANMDEMFRQYDVVVICCTLNDKTYHMITGDLLRSMKEGAALVNVARGEIIDEDALVQVMGERPDLRVVVDVLEGETTGTQNPERLRRLGAIVTPHIAGETYESRTKAARIILGLLKRECYEQHD
jgi:D-3-phosphoglycerate dehydrogenase